MPAIFIFLILFLGYLLLVLGYFCLKAEYTIRKKLFSIWLMVAVVFALLAATAKFSQRQSNDGIRIAILPLADFTSDDHCAWFSFFIVDQANSALQSALIPQFRIFPQRWLWQCLDGDSIRDSRYLQDFCRRIQLDYAVIGAVVSGEEEIAIDFSLFKMPEAKLLRQGRVMVPWQHKWSLGEKLAQQIISYCKPAAVFEFTTTTHAEPFIIQRTCAQKFLAMRDFHKAAYHAAQAFALDSTDVTTRNIYAEALILNGLRSRYLDEETDGELLLALRLCEGTILQHDHKNAEAYRLLAKYYLTEKLYNKAETFLLKSLALDPDQPAALVDFSYLHPSRFRNIKYKNEEQILRRALAINPCCEEARLRLADFYYYQNNPTKARRTIEDLLAIHPRSIDGLMYLGKLAMEKQDFAKFAKIYDILLQIDGQNPEIYYNLGVYYYHLQDLEQSEQFFNRAIQLGNHLDSHFYLGYIYEKKGMIDQATKEYGLRIRGRRGADDEFAEEARKRLQILTKPDSSILHANEH